MGLIPAEYWNAAPLPFWVALSQSVHWNTLFHVALLSIFFPSWISSVVILRWQGFNLTLDRWTSDFHWFEALGAGAGALTGPDVLAWRVGSECSYRVASEQFVPKKSKRLGHCFSLNCPTWQNTEKKVAQAQGFQTLIPLHGQDL